MTLTEVELIKLLRLYISDDGKCYATAAALAGQIMFAEEQAQKVQADIADRIMWGTD